MNIDRASINTQTREGLEQMTALGIKPIPVPDDLTRPYWEAARRHELVIQRCKACGEYRHPPSAQCSECSAKDTEWVKISGKGTVYTFTIDHRNRVPSFSGTFVIVLVNPIEAQRDTVRITANIRESDVHDVYIGMPVEVTFEDVSPEVTLPQFRPAPEARLRSKG